MAENSHDQAAGLRRQANPPRPVKVIAVASGKGQSGCCARSARQRSSVA